MCYVSVGLGLAVTERRGRRGQVWYGPLRRSRLGLVVRGEEWQGGRGLERLVTVRLGEAVVARLGEMSCGLAR